MNYKKTPKRPKSEVRMSVSWRPHDVFMFLMRLCKQDKGKRHGMPGPVSASVPLLRFGFLKRFVQPPMNESKI